MKSKIVLVTPHSNSHRTAEETMALGYLAKVLRNSGYDVMIIDGWLRGLNALQITDIISNYEPDILCMSCYRSNLSEAEVLLHNVFANIGKIPTICGGYGPTFNDYDFLKSGFTIAIRGEAEHILVDLVSTLIANGDVSKVSGISFLKNSDVIRIPTTSPVIDLDLLQFPDRDEIEFTKLRNNPVHVCTSRGCNASCSFCSIFAFALNTTPEHRWRQRSIKNIVEELKYLYETFGVYNIKFVDDSFLEPPRNEKWTADFAEEIIKAKIPLRFRTQVRADRLNEFVVKNLKSAGWFSTSIGIENASKTALKRMGKSATPEDNERALNLLRDHEIYVQMGMILFDHKTTFHELEENYEFLKRHNWVVTKGIFTEMFAAEGTNFTNILNKKGLLVNASFEQNRSYKMGDPLVMRAYAMLKDWHKSHAKIYDWVIDSITAPKVLPLTGYIEVHSLCRKLIDSDLKFFRIILDYVKSSDYGDQNLLNNSIKESSNFYSRIEKMIEIIYRKYNLTYDGITNPFLNL